MIFRALRKFFGVTLLSLLLSTDAYAEFYDVKIKKIAPKAVTGDVIIQFKPGAKENGFSEKSRGMLAGDDPGTNRGLGVILTAISLGTEVTIQMENPPSFDVIQVITSTSISTP